MGQKFIFILINKILSYLLPFQFNLMIYFPSELCNKFFYSRVMCWYEKVVLVSTVDPLNTKMLD